MKKTFIIVIMLVIVSLLLINTNTIKATTDSNTDNQKFSLKIIKGNEELYLNEGETIISKYNTLMLPIDVTFNKIFGNYSSVEEEQELIYNDLTLKIKYNENIINVSNIYQETNDQVDNSVDVEIEEIDGKKYIPVYLLANIPGIEVLVDNKKVYDQSKYLNSTEAMKKGKTDHTIEINLSDTEEKKENSSTAYLGGEDGALWREEAYKRIEKYRKNDVNIIVKNQNGQEIKNAKVTLNMNNNDFKFGTAIRKVEATGINKYTGIAKNLFNAIGSENGFKWPTIYSNGSEIAKDVISFAKENNMRIRGHYLWLDGSMGETR